jgi:hypothetical protein
MSDKPTLKIDWCSFDAAKFAVERWHYSGCMPSGKLVRLGAWEDDRFIGCVLFGRGANSDLLKPYGLDQTEGAELVRVALRSHKTPVTRIVAIALRFLVQKCPGLRLVVSFADPEQGHVGGIYQGGGWIYTGRSQSADEYIVNGKRIHGRSLRALRASDRRAPHAKNAEEWARLVLDPNTKKISGSSKHRYLMPLDEGMRRRVSQIAKPYPKKRAGSIVDDAPVVQTGEGGSVPTPALPRAAAAGE